MIVKCTALAKLIYPSIAAALGGVWASVDNASFPFSSRPAVAAGSRVYTIVDSDQCSGRCADVASGGAAVSDMGNIM